MCSPFVDFQIVRIHPSKEGKTFETAEDFKFSIDILFSVPDDGDRHSTISELALELSQRSQCYLEFILLCRLPDRGMIYLYQGADGLFQYCSLDTNVRTHIFNTLKVKFPNVVFDDHEVTAAMVPGINKTLFVKKSIVKG